MKVCIAEKPSVAKEIANVLGAKTRKDGYYEGSGYQVTWTFGHLCTLKEPHDYTEYWKWWNLNALPMLPPKFGIKLIDNKGVEKQFNTIKTLVNNCDEVINCGDAGQEGEVIQRWVLSLSGCKKPMKRLWISSLTEEAIKEGFTKLKDASEFDNLYAAGSSRAIGDWLLGMNATRLFTLKFAKEKQVLSVGRVQTPTLSLIVERHKSIENFTSEKYWEIKTIYRDTHFNSSAGKFEKVEKANELLDTLKDKEFEVVSFKQKEGKESPLRLFDLTSLQVECNKTFGYSADETLKIAQKLYERKIITYPRVDTTYLSEDIYKKVPGILSNLKYYSQLTAPLLSGKIKKSKKVFDDKKVTDHHAIIPTGELPSGLTPEEKRTYDQITKRFISVFYPDCIVSNTSVEGKVEKVKFKTSGRQILDPGWRVVYDKSSTAEDNSEENTLPLFEEGEKGVHFPSVQERKTSPPKYFTEATLLRAMETAGKNVDDENLRELMKDNGIGRPSTRANIIETLYRRKYIKKAKKRIEATQIGVNLIDTINNDLLKSAELTGQWEKKLRDIERGELKVDQFKAELFQMVQKLVNEVKYSNQSIQIGETPKPIQCPKCKNGTIISGKTAYGCTEWKNECDFKIPFTIEDITVDLTMVKEIVENKKLVKIYKNPLELVKLLRSFKKETV